MRLRCGERLRCCAAAQQNVVKFLVDRLSVEEPCVRVMLLKYYFARGVRTERATNQPTQHSSSSEQSQEASKLAGYSDARMK